MLSLAIFIELSISSPRPYNPPTWVDGIGEILECGRRARNRVMNQEILSVSMIHTPEKIQIQKC